MVILVTFQIKTGMKISEKIKSLENNDKFSPFSLLATENESEFTQILRNKHDIRPIYLPKASNSLG